MTLRFESADALADAVIERVGKSIVLGLPVGIGKALHVANALYRRACSDTSISLRIFTGLTLTTPRAGSVLEARLLEPIAERLYAAWPNVDYADALSAGTLPANVSVREFYLRPGAYLDNPGAQQAYTSINYSEVAEVLLAMGVNVIAQLVASDPDCPGSYSLGSNPEVTLDLLPALRERSESRPYALVGQANSAMPYMQGEAELPASAFDFILEHPDLDYPLFPLPNRRVAPADYATGMHVASLVPDGGTLQVGIGSLSDAVAQCLRLRHERPETFAHVLARLPGGIGSARRLALPVETSPFREGVYACTELLSDALFSLYTAGIVRRPAEAGSETCVHAGFFIGSDSLYQGLRDLPPERRRQIAMSRISFVNTLFGEEDRKREQRRGACFVNETMMATLLGAAVSDALGDGRVVSGIGGQFDFVAMASALRDGRSILMLRARREREGAAESNIRFAYPHTSIPRQHRDLFVSEYGLAETRARSDAGVIDAMLHIADAKFQAGLLREARAAGKLPADYALDAGAADNRPDRIAAVFREPDVAPWFPPYPLGTPLTPEEQSLAEALTWLRDAAGGWRDRATTVVRALLTPTEDRHAVALRRMGLHATKSLRGTLDRKLVNLALKETR